MRADRHHGGGPLHADEGPEPSLLELVESQYERAAHRNLRRVLLDLPVVPELLSASGRIFAEVDRDDHNQRDLARHIWIAKSTILHTLLPFDDPRLELERHAREIEMSAAALPNTKLLAKSLARLLRLLVEQPLNPKREWLLRGVAGKRSADTAVAVLAAVQGSATPGWPVDLSSPNDFGSENVALIRARRELRDRVFDRVVIPGNTRFAKRALIADLLYGGRARDIFVLAYNNERSYVPMPISLPKDQLFHGISRTHVHIDPPVEEGVDVELDHWANQAVWDEIRARHRDMAPASDGDVAVTARYVLFADESGAFLPDDRRVVEISTLVDSGGKLSPTEEKLPRKAVRDLEEGDLVLLRLAGGGHFVEDMADHLMASDGLETLRHEATEWKEFLYRTLKRHGDGYVGNAAKKLGLRLRHSNYLWNWGGDVVMAPHDFGTFEILIRAVAKLGELRGVEDPAAYALQKWHQMERVKAYHIRAGSMIRTALLERVSALVATGQKIHTVASIELPGVQAGKMGLLRVSAVDTKPMLVPLSQLFHIRPARGK